MISGFATLEGTKGYVKRQFETSQNHYRQFRDLWLSDLGIGTYLGKWDKETDESYTKAIQAGIQKGIQVLDAAINYRFMRSERSIGAALKALIAQKKMA